MREKKVINVYGFIPDAVNSKRDKANGGTDRPAWRRQSVLQAGTLVWRLCWTLVCWLDASVKVALDDSVAVVLDASVLVGR